jgi:cellulose biosynthesis protein BcsQ
MKLEQVAKFFCRATAQAIDRLEEALREISEHYDFLILDCPPNLGLLFTASLKATEHVIDAAHASPHGGDTTPAQRSGH